MRTDCRYSLVSKVTWCLSKKEWRRLCIIGLKVEINIFHMSGASPFICFPVCELPLYVQGRTVLCFECLPAYEKRLPMRGVIVAPGNFLIFWYCCRYGPCYSLLYCFLSSMSPSLGGSDHVSIQQFCLALHFKPKRALLYCRDFLKSLIAWSLVRDKWVEKKYDGVVDGCTNPARQFSRASKFCMVAADFCGSPSQTFKSPFRCLEFWRCFQIFGKCVHPWHSERHYIYYRMGEKNIYSSECSKAVPACPSRNSASAARYSVGKRRR